MGPELDVRPELFDAGPDAGRALRPRFARTRTRAGVRRRCAEVRTDLRGRRAVRLASRRVVLRGLGPAPAGGLRRVSAGHRAAGGSRARALRLVARRATRVHDSRSRRDGGRRRSRRPRARRNSPHADARRSADRLLPRDARDELALPAGRLRPAGDDGGSVAVGATRAWAGVVVAARCRRRHRAGDEVHACRRPRPPDRRVLVWRRDALSSSGLALAVAVAVVLVVPNLVWEAGHGWTSVHFFLHPPPSGSDETRPSSSSTCS